MRDLQPIISPSRTVVTSFTPKTTAASEFNNNNNNSQSSLDYFEQGDWVLGVTACHKWVSCALSNGEVQVYDQDSMRLQQTYKMNTSTGNTTNGHHPLVTDLVGDLSSANPNTLVATATDGTITLFDIRQSVPAFSLRLPRAPDEQALSVSLGFEGSLAAVGTSKSNIHFYDVRNHRSLLGTYNQAHTQGVTKVRFQMLSSFGTTSTTSPILISGGEDGLVCVFDTSQSSEETALKNVLAVQSPIRQVGFFGLQSKAIYCLTGDESLKLYHMEDSVCRKDYGSQLREYLSHLSLGGGGGGDTVSSSQPSQSLMNMEYLVDCYWDTARQELLLCAGNNSGDAGLFKVQEHDISLSHRLAGGHRGVIRALGSLSTHVFVTVGEDARMCEWNRLGRQLHAAATAHTVPPPPRAPETAVRRLASPVAVSQAKTGGGPMRRQQQRGSMTASPY
jgi:WD40 repeat protein